MAYETPENKYDQTPQIKTPAAGPRPKKGAMPTDELQTLVEGLFTSARQYIDVELTPDRAKASRYYKGEPFGNELKGRSQFVVTEVHDGVQAVLPPLLRTIFGPEAVVEFRPRTATGVDRAAQATDYIRYVFEEEGDGFMRSLAVLKDGLIRRHGIWKWGWDDTSETTQDKFVGTVEELAGIMADEDVNVTLVRELKDQPGMIEAEYTRKLSDGKPWFCEVPPEEFIAIRESRSLNDTLFCAHVTRKTTGELIAMGISKKVIEEKGGDDKSLTESEDAIERTPNSAAGEDVDAGKANEYHIYGEGYARIDYDGDGISELRKICTVGPSFHVVSNDPCDDINIAVWCPDPEPHSLMGGRSWADRLMDMQRLKSQLMRAMLDSASGALHTRKWYKEGDANLADLLSTNIGSPIRTRSGANAVGEFAHSFMGKELLPVLQLTDDIVERRTGQSKGAVNMDADALQSSTKTAVAAAVTAAQAQQEMLVRIFAESAMKPLFRGLLKLFCQHKPKARVVKLRGKWVEVNPAHWDANMDVQVNVALGSGMVEEKLQTLFDIAQHQKEILQTMGPQNPLVTLKQYRDTLVEMAALRGKKDGSRYFLEITDDQIKQMAEAAANAPPPPSPEMEMAKAKIAIAQESAKAKAQTEMMKAQLTAQLEQHKADAEVKRELAEAEITAALEQKRAEIEMQRMQLEDDRERDAKAADIQLAIVEMELKYGVKLSEVEITAQIERERIQSQEAGAGAKIASTERMHEQKIQSGEKVADGKNKSSEKVASKRGATVKAPGAGKPRKRKVTVERDKDGRPAAYNIEDVEGDE